MNHYHDKPVFEVAERQDFDPESVPIRPAATVMLIDDRPDLQLFMMERHANTVFAGGMWVFPGGAVDPDDSVDKHALHRTDSEASQLMDLEQGGLAYYMAAIRETFEESGILLAIDKTSGNPVDTANNPKFEDYRIQLNAGELAFHDLLAEENLIADVGQMHYIARWITPLGSPRRFDARFFIAKIPTDQIPMHDDGELVNSAWLAPAEILRRVDQDDMVLMTPTIRMVKCLQPFDSAEQAIDSAASNLPDHRARVHRETGVILLPGDAGYEDGLTDVENGWVRLRRKSS